MTSKSTSSSSTNNPIGQHAQIIPMTGDDMLEIGRIAKAHGIRGEVVVVLHTNRLERVAPGAELFGDGRTFTVETSRPHQQHHLVHFEGVFDRTFAESLRGIVLSAPPLDDPDELWVHDLLDAEVVLPDGTAVGSVEAVEANPASDLLILTDGGIVPLTFFVEWDDDGQIVIDPPVGLLDPLHEEE